MVVWSFGEGGYQHRFRRGERTLERRGHADSFYLGNLGQEEQMKTPTRVCALMAVVPLLCGAGCGQKNDEQKAKAEDFGWFSYAPPEGWKRLDLSRDASSIAFLPSSAVRGSEVCSLEVSQVDWMKVKEGELAAACIGDIRQQWEHDKKQAELQGKTAPPFQCKKIAGVIDWPGQIDAYSIQLVRNGRFLNFLTHYIETPGGRRFIVEFVGSDPVYTQQLAAVKSSLETLQFADAN
jgi:hypothetical protein